MDTTQCINNPDWIAYAEGTLNAAALLYLQEHVRSCAICADMKEGIDAMPRPALLQQRISRIHSRVDDRSTPKRRALTGWYWMAAAVLLAGIAGTWLLKNPPAGNTLTQQQPPASPLPENTLPAPIPEQQQNEQQAEIPAPEKGRKVQVHENATSPPEKDREQPLVEKIIVEDRQVVLAETFKKPADQETEKSTTSDDYREDKKSLGKYKKETLPSSYNNSYNNLRNFPSLNNSGNLLSETDTTGDAARYAAALLDFGDSLYPSCLEQLQPVISNTASLYYEDALLLSARALLALEQSAEAKDLLQKILLLEGPRREEAQQLLEHIK